MDGLRALAVLPVIAYHLNIPFAAGGFLGVTVFFVLSGFLITTLLAWEWEHCQTIDLKHFWIRRAKRLLPAMFLVLLALNVFIPVFQPELVKNLHKDTIAAIFYYSNWHYIFRDLSYFESFGITSLLTHFWSLAIEEQFYIIWAPIILCSFKWIKNRKIFIFLMMIGAGLSAVWMMMVYEPHLDPSRVYYGTDTRLFSLLIGSSFALLLPRRTLTTHVSKAGIWALEITAIIGILVFLLMVVYTNQYDSFVYQGGMVLLSITTALLTLSLAVPSTVMVKKILEWKPLRWIGIRSYGIYLWHYPVIVLMNSNVNTDGINYLKITFEIALTFILASLSYTFIEKPIRHGTFRFNTKNSITLVTAICLLVGAANSVPKFSTRKMTVAFHGEVSHHPVQKTAAKIAFSEEKTGAEAQPKPVPSITTGKITAIGDSVLVIPAPFLKETFSSIMIDAKVSRQMRDAFSIVTQLKKANNLGDIVIIELGTNGPFPEKTITDLLRNIGKERKVLFINVRVPRPWEAIVNKSLEEISKKHSNMSIIDWYSTSANHNEYFVNDGVHLKPEGARAFAAMIEEAVQKAINASP
ncbi:acyltransferase family protein [Priestia abyssalis]|uniref:acyltransferase family protein n=1 Tax=Priestia abyssalis TaxID=1221450 RepID=UPI0014750526|nr:acyltransferase family protein [Priestia abyssalis]